MRARARILPALPLLLLATSLACDSKPAGAEDAVQGGMLKGKSHEVQAIQPVEADKIVAPAMVQGDANKIVAPDMIQGGANKIVAPDMIQGGANKIVAPDMVQGGANKIVAPDMIQGKPLIGEDGKQAIEK